MCSGAGLARITKVVSRAWSMCHIRGTPIINALWHYDVNFVLLPVAGREKEAGSSKIKLGCTIGMVIDS